MNSRSIAARILCRTLKDGVTLTAALEEAAPDIASDKDKSFVQALCYGVLRWYHRLEFIIGVLAHKPIKDLDVKVLAMIGLFQINHMRVKPHAAVSETVSAAGRRPWVKSLLNALLRSYLRDRESIDKKAEQEEWSAYSHPEWLIDRLKQDWPERYRQILDENNRLPPMVLRVNLNRGSRELYAKKLANAGILSELPSNCPSAIVLAHPVPVECLPGYLQGEFFVQDSAAQLASGLLDLQPGQRVLDVCSAPGGKTTHILEAQTRLAELTAVDIDEKRLARVGENLRRLGLNAKLIAGDAAQPERWWDGKGYDRILLDAPCSATGVIRRHPDIKVLRKPDDLRQLQSLQRSILGACWRLLAPRGLLLYATCSVLKEENECQVRSFLEHHPDAVEETIGADWGLRCIHGRQILTGDGGMDGFFYARIRKK
ncbi:MAG: 16S rRNA (cytosine(967)-C(5))-methyltransferase RsmB [Gammaproteobacteria bacterium]